MQHVKEPLTLAEIGELLVKHYGLNEGLYDLAVEFSFGFGAVGPTDDSKVPGVMLGVNKIGLIEAQTKSNSTLDAAEINPKKTPKKK